jgi:hypothetical protein
MLNLRTGICVDCQKQVSNQTQPVYFSKWHDDQLAAELFRDCSRLTSGLLHAVGGEAKVGGEVERLVQILLPGERTSSVN